MSVESIICPQQYFRGFFVNLLSIFVSLMQQSRNQDAKDCWFLFFGSAGPVAMKGALKIESTCTGPTGQEADVLSVIFWLVALGFPVLTALDTA